jgi:hypothetical protein
MMEFLVNVTPKRRLTFTGLFGVISQMIENSSDPLRVLAIKSMDGYIYIYTHNLPIMYSLYALHVKSIAVNIIRL